VYNVTASKTLPAWLSEAKKRALRKDDEFRRRVELLQDFSFPAACQRIKATPDGQFLFATGYHPPVLKAYDLANLALKFDRHLTAEVVEFQVLSEDYSKAAFLCADRSLEFHARFGGEAAESDYANIRPGAASGSSGSSGSCPDAVDEQTFACAFGRFLRELRPHPRCLRLLAADAAGADIGYAAADAMLREALS